MSTIEELYYENMRSIAKNYKSDSPFAQSAMLKNKNLEKLMTVLNDSEKELFEKYCDAQSEVEDIIRYDAFSCALKFGILLMVEVFAKDGGEY